MRVLLRTDASEQMGSGHVMRCLTLAQALIGEGSEVAFVCREHAGDLIHYLRSNQVQVFGLPTDLDSAIKTISPTEPDPNLAASESLYHSEWLGVSQQTDFEQSKQYILEFQPDWIVVDHYALDQYWEQRAATLCERIFVIDDLGDRRHHCSILLDQTYGCLASKYDGLVPETTMLLTGSEYSLLRPEFLHWRETSLRRRVDAGGDRFFIFMGGTDPENITGAVISQVAKVDNADSLRVTVVLGTSCPNIVSVRQQLLDAPFKESQLLVGISNMAEVMACNDLAIGAAGSATWERCCLAIPSIQFVIAKNQEKIAQRLEGVKAAEVLTDIGRMQQAISSVMISKHKFSFVSSVIADGLGVGRVLRAIKGDEVGDISLRPIDLDDADFVFGLQTKNIRQFFRNPRPPSYPEHIEWFKKIYNSIDNQLLIIEYCGVPIGVLRLDHLALRVIEVSIIIAPKFAGQGFGKKSLIKLDQLLPGRILKAEVHQNNISSKRLFEHCGYEYHSRSGRFLEFRKYV